MFPLANEGRYETLNEGDCDRFLTSLETKGVLVASLAAELTPFVHALYNGEELAAASRSQLTAALAAVSENQILNSSD